MKRVICFEIVPHGIISSFSISSLIPDDALTTPIHRVYFFQGKNLGGLKTEVLSKDMLVFKSMVLMHYFQSASYIQQGPFHLSGQCN